MSFGFSDIVIFVTLIINAGAVLNFKLKSPLMMSVNDPANNCESATSRVLDFLYSLRYFRVLILLWNIVVAILMFVFFS